MDNQQPSPDEGKVQRLSRKRVEYLYSKWRNNVVNNQQILKPCRLSLQEQNRIIQLYTQNHLTIKEISKQTHHKELTVSKVLHNHNIDIKKGLPKYIPTEEEIQIVKTIIEGHQSYNDAARAIKRDVTIVKRIINENHIIYDYRPYNKNLIHDYFSVIDSPKKAWLLGFLFTDGSVRKVGNSYQIRLSIQQNDEEIINQIKNWLNIDTKTHYDCRENKKCCGIEIASQQMFEDLAKYGIVPNKTYNTKGLSLNLIPDEFKRDYIRGLFDGDGGISFTGNIYEISCDFTSYYYETVEEMRDFIDKAVDKKEHNKIAVLSNKCRCSWRGRRQVVKILSWLYDDSNVYLKRKYDKYLWIKSTL